MNFRIHIAVLGFIVASGCSGSVENRLTVIAPAHFHASLIQKEKLEGVCDTVNVFAPGGEELESYLETVRSFNSRECNPTAWVEKVYSGSDYIDAVPEAGKGEFVILSGNNRDKTEYIAESIKKGYNVLSDKPMAISSQNWRLLEKAYSDAEQKGLVIYDLMTERYETLNILAKALLADKDLFPDGADSVDIVDIHHFCKMVLGKPTRRPGWYYDVKQQGEGIADVTTHFIDLIFWELFPEQPIGVANIENLTAEHYPTEISPEQYRLSTGLETFPDYLKEYVNINGNLDVYSNGKISFNVNGTYVNIAVRWDFMPSDEKVSDSFCQRILSKKAELDILQDRETGYKRELFIKSSDEDAVMSAIKRLSTMYPYVSVTKTDDDRFHVSVPDEYRTGHEEHFSKVARTFISSMNDTGIQEWEKVNTLTKYYITTTAVEMANRQ